MIRIHVYACFNITETEKSSFWWNIHHWLHWKLSTWQLPVQLVMKISSKWHFCFSDYTCRCWWCYRHVCCCFVTIPSNWHIGYIFHCHWLNTLAYWDRDKMAAILQTASSNAFSWMKMYEFRENFHLNCFYEFKWQYSSIGFDNGLVPTRRQAFITTNGGLVNCRIYVSLPMN